MDSRLFSPSSYIQKPTDGDDDIWLYELMNIMDKEQDFPSKSPPLFQMSKVRRDGSPFVGNVMFSGFLRDNSRYLLFMVDRRNSDLIADLQQSQPAVLSLSSSMAGKIVQLSGNIYVVKDPRISCRGSPPQVSPSSDPKDYWENERLKSWISQPAHVRGLFMSSFTLGYYGGVESLEINTSNRKLLDILNVPAITRVLETANESTVKHDAALYNFCVLCFKVSDMQVTSHLVDFPPKIVTYKIKDDKKDSSLFLLQDYVQQIFK